MAIWFRAYNLESIKDVGKGNLGEHLGIELIELGDNYLKGRMPVDARTKQPTGVLHGGASTAFAESLGSIAGNLVIDMNKFTCVGLDINANHLRPVSEGYVYGIAFPFHLGKKTQVWSIEIHNSEGKLICISRLTLAVIEYNS
jgi:1,4-dihydroxy-2-naphthoyl-CoA hydrolase